MGAPLDWVQTYEAARTGAYGDQSQAVLDRIAQQESGNDAYQKLADSGVLAPQRSQTYSNETGTGTRMATSDDSVDWSQLPKLKAAPAGFSWQALSTDGSPGLTSDKFRQGVDPIYTYDDPNYGKQGLFLNRGADDQSMTILRSLAIAAAAGPIAGGIAAGAAEAGVEIGTLGTAAIKTGLSAVINGAATGQTPNPFSLLFQVLKPSFNLSSLMTAVSTTAETAGG